MKSLVVAVLMLAAATTQAANVCVIDSGTDILHKDLLNNLWINSNEIPSNDRDEDRNGYQDDVYGWNFAESNNLVIDHKYRGTLTFDIRRFFAIQKLMMEGTANDEDVAWLRGRVGDQEFLKSLQIYGNFMHGTHVTGIAVKGNPDARAIAVKLIPTEVKLPFLVREAKKLNQKGLGVTLAKMALGALAKQQLKLMVEIGQYCNDHGAKVANGSFGTGYPQAKMIASAILKITVKEPTEAEVEEVTKHFIDTLVTEGLHFVNAAKRTLFVFAAGNDGLNNDKFGTFPTNISADNVISVAASIKPGQLSSFSNFGKTNVDVAAPGVGINSTVPDNNYLEVSGTSQAAPYVANIANRVVGVNSDLLPVQVKQIIMKTVDSRRGYSANLVTGGDVNMARAVRAAELTLKMNISEAIAESHRLIKDDYKEDESSRRKSQSGPNGYVLPLPSVFAELR
ncbi:MAG: S8 family serine peptidase [Halobacteriovoraceae bacterium]|jgi:cell wall-associated protease|nr:S8 family serine peptidase [Halobacteriovoraceae bacterium]MBT5094904.1 S8 family serine peptidase [Halobacteriovoraceae bacterium]